MFFKQKTAYEIRISDWSSDVCSSDLPLRLLFLARQGPRADCRSLASRGIGADGTAASLRYETSIARTELLRDIRAGQCVAGRSQARSDRARGHLRNRDRERPDRMRHYCEIGRAHG